MILRLSTLLISLLLLLSCSDSDSDTLPNSGEVSIAYLKSLCKGDHYRIVNDYTIKGTVVANDWLGELNKSIIVVDQSGGIEIAIESHKTYELAPLYSEIEILCNGFTLSRIGGKIELGAEPTGDFPLDNIEKEAFSKAAKIVGSNSTFSATTLLISELSVEHISSIAQFNRLRICDEEQGLSWCDIAEGEIITTYRHLVDERGDTLAVRTLPTCTYALEIIPQKEISVAGAIDYSNNRYFLRILNQWIK